MKRKDTKTIDFATPSITRNEIDAVVSILKTGWITTGRSTKIFGDELANYIGAKYCIPMSSCTAALHIALLCAGVGEGDEVITTPFTFVSTINTILQVGGRPVFVDIKPNDHIMDESLVEAAITKRTKAILPVHYGGYAANLGKIRAIARKHKLEIIEDAAHAYGSKYRDEYIGQKSKFACFSFYPTKNITSIEGGALVTNSRKVYERACSLALHGISRDAWKRYTKEGSWRYDVLEIGYKYNMTDVQAAVGLAQLNRIESLKLKRDAIFNIYRNQLESIRGIDFLLGNSHTRAFRHLCVLKINSSKLSRDQFIEEMKLRNIVCSVHFIPVYRFSIYHKLLKIKYSDYPNTEKAFSECVSIPFNSSMSLADAKYVTRQIKDVLSI